MRKGYELDPSERLLEIIDGQLLGDGSVVRNKGPMKIAKSAYLAVTSAKGAYLRGLSAQLAAEGMINRAAPDGRGLHYLYSRSYRDLLPERVRWYPSGKKAIPHDIRVTPLSCLMWYLGDGYLRPEGNTHPSLYTCGFALEDVKFLQTKLIHEGIDCTVQRPTKNPLIYIRRAEQWFNYIGDCPSWASDYSYRWPRTEVHV